MFEILNMESGKTGESERVIRLRKTGKTNIFGVKRKTFTFGNR